ncbi:MAG: ATPase, T2SS/T4P/T4SS family [Nitrososphaerota archaeon]
MKLRELLDAAVELGATDVHVDLEQRPRLRIKGRLTEAGQYPPVSLEGILDFLKSIPTFDMEKFTQGEDVDFSFTVREVRWRGHCGRSLDGITLSVRKLSATPPAPEELGLPAKLVEEVLRSEGGLFLITGPTGSGKSTTMASLINEVLRTRSVHILTLEDPIEYIFPPTPTCKVTQRQVGIHVPSFAEGLRAALRMDPDFIVVGEMRDQETVRIALQAADTGHTVMGTLHTIDAPGAVGRIIGMFPPDYKSTLLTQFAYSLRAVFAQRLLPKSPHLREPEGLKEKGGRVLAGELMLSNESVRANILQENVQGLKAVIKNTPGMMTMEEAIARLVKEGVVMFEDALRYVKDVVGFKAYVRL